MARSDENTWVPTNKQARFLQVPTEILEGFYAGAVGAGKSDVLLAYPVVHRWHENPNWKGIYFRRTYPELENEIIPRSKRFYSPFGAKYNKQSKLWEFPGLNRSKSPQGAGALLFFGHCENEDDVHKYDSMQINYAAFDELTSFTEWQYLYITLQRVRSNKISNLPAVVRSASNPGNIGHAFVKKRFVDPAPNGGIVLKNAAGLKRIYIPATLADNPYISDEYRASLESLPDAERKAKLYGDWNAYEGQVFDEFRERHYPDEPENALHVIEPFEIPEWWPKIAACDWGYTPPAMTCLHYGAISPDRRLYMYREQTWQKTPVEEWASQAKLFLDKEGIRVFKLCKSASQDRGLEHTVHSQVETALDRKVELTGNMPGSRIAGKMLMHEYFRWKPKSVRKVTGYLDPDKAAWILRNRSIDEYRSYIDSFKEQQPESNLPKLQVFNTCPKFINAIKSCVFDKNKTEDVAEFPGDDPYDSGRYLVDAADKFFDESESRNKQIESERELAQMKDMHAFYMAARSREAQSQTFGVSRFHRGRR